MVKRTDQRMQNITEPKPKQDGTDHNPCQIDTGADSTSKAQSLCRPLVTIRGGGS